MSRQANPRLIGAFLFVAGLLLLVIFALIGSLRTFNSRKTFVVYFKGSVNNLNVGAKVKWKGVPVGQVSDVRIRWNQDVFSTEIPVFIEIDLARLGLELDDKEELKREIAAGLRARLEMESLISGMLYIQLNYVENTDKPVFHEKEPIYPELPAAPSPFDELGNLAFKIAYNVSCIDFKKISDNLNASLEKMNKVMDGLDAEGISRSVKSAANSVTSLAGSPKIMELLDNASQTVTSIRNLSASLETMSKPLPGQVEAISARAQKTLESIDETSSQLRAAMADDSDTVVSLNEALREMAAAARSARELTDFIERNPNALIMGRQASPEEKK
jgi:paraquat-inducible protein B